MPWVLFKKTSSSTVLSGLRTRGEAESFTEPDDTRAVSFIFYYYFFFQYSLACSWYVY